MTDYGIFIRKGDEKLKELWMKIWEALLSALPITAIVYMVSLLPGFHFSSVELITFSVGAGLSRQR